MKELSKSIQRRLANPNFITKYLKGDGLDVGGKSDPLCLYAGFFPLMTSARTWDMEDGDAQYLATVADDSLDFVHSSHCLEHMRDPATALSNWFRVIKPGGYLMVTVPDEDLYEQGIFPSSFNKDHKWTFTMFKEKSWSQNSISVIGLVQKLGAGADVVKLELIDSTYRYDLPRYDQTLAPVGECCIELIIRKRHTAEVSIGGRLPDANAQVEEELRIHLNQYRDDHNTLKSANPSKPPFGNKNPL